jgi:hypothetical protein
VQLRYDRKGNCLQPRHAPRSSSKTNKIRCLACYSLLARSDGSPASRSLSEQFVLECGNERVVPPVKPWGIFSGRLHRTYDIRGLFEASSFTYTLLFLPIFLDPAMRLLRFQQPDGVFFLSFSFLSFLGHAIYCRSHLITKGHCRSHEELSHLLSEMSQSHPARYKRIPKKQAASLSPSAR